MSVISNISTCVWLRTVFIEILQPESTLLVAVLVGHCYVLVASVHEDRLSGDSGADGDAELSAVSKECKNWPQRAPGFGARVTDDKLAGRAWLPWG